MDAIEIYRDVFLTLSQQGFKNVHRRLAKLPKSHRSVVEIIEAFALEEADFVNLRFLRSKASTTGTTQSNKSDTAHPPQQADANGLTVRVEKELQQLHQNTTTTGFSRTPSDIHIDAMLPTHQILLEFILVIIKIRTAGSSILTELYLKHNNADIETYIQTLKRCIESLDPYRQHPCIVQDYAQAVWYELQISYHLLQLNERIRHYDFFSSTIHMFTGKQHINEWRRLCLPQQTDQTKTEEPSSTTAGASTWATLWNSLSESIYPGRSGYSYPPLLQWLSQFYKALCAKMTIYFEKQLADRQAQLAFGDMKHYWKQLEPNINKSVVQLHRRALAHHVGLYHFNQDHGQSQFVHNFGFQLQTNPELIPKTAPLTCIYNCPEPLSDSQQRFLKDAIVAHQRTLEQNMLQAGRKPMVVLPTKENNFVYWLASVDSQAMNFLVVTFKPIHMKTVKEVYREELWYEVLADIRLTRIFDTLIQLSF
ncbi:hypothetical protein IWQ61_004194 [Dispira simplex]|nr:hypothetical protein IWQ61_004194 [Dispira simplex]